MIQYKIFFKDGVFYHAQAIKDIVKCKLITIPIHEDHYNSYISNLKKMAGIEIDTEHITGHYVIPSRVRLAK